jgi:hypothetical protein
MLYPLPTAKEDVLKVATPLTKLTGVPMGCPSTRNWTVPVAVPAPGETAATIAVKVTDCPKTEGMVEANVVVVLALFTTWLTGVLVLVRKLESPA